MFDPTEPSHVPLIFICDNGTSGVPGVYQSYADDLDFARIPVDIEHPIAVAHDSEEDTIFWIDAASDSLNRAFRSGFDRIQLGFGNGE